MPAVVIVTRPANSGQRLFDRLVERGHRAVWWPAFDIEAAPDVSAARATLARLADYDLAVFVSASAVRAVQPMLQDAWPTGTAIGAVGASTRAAIEADLRPSAPVIAPSNDDESGSEAFWHAWQASGRRRAQRVLLLRAEDGREWLRERFIENGASVDTVAVYSRRPHRLTAADQMQLNEWVTAEVRPAIVFSSSEAIAALDRQVGVEGRTWLRTGVAIASHARIAEKLSEHGYACVMNATFDDDSVIAKLESICNTS